MDDEELKGGDKLNEKLDGNHIIFSPRPLRPSQSSYLVVGEAEDPLESISNTLQSTDDFIEMLRQLDNPAGSSTSPTRDLETILQAHLHRLTVSDRIREEQCRELLVVGREIGNTDWEGVELDLILGRGLGLEMFDLEEEENEGSFVIGWTSIELDTSTATPVSTEISQGHLDTSIGTVDPLSSFDLDTSDPDLLILTPWKELPRLRHATSSVMLATHTLFTSLRALTESLESISSASITTSRQLRGIRVGIDSWREREAYEEVCRVQVEEWETKRVRGGLRGLGVSEVLKREVREFEAVVNRLESRMGEMRSRACTVL